MVDVAEAVQDVGLPAAPARLPERLECLLAAAEGLLVVAELGVVPADVVQAHSLARPVSCCPVETDGLLGVVHRLIEAPGVVREPAEAAVAPRLADVIPDRFEQAQCLAGQGAGLAGAARPDVADGQAVQGVCLPGGVARAAGGL